MQSGKKPQAHRTPAGKKTGPARATRKKGVGKSPSCRENWKEIRAGQVRRRCVGAAAVTCFLAAVLIFRNVYSGRELQDTYANTIDTAAASDSQEAAADTAVSETEAMAGLSFSGLTGDGKKKLVQDTSTSNLLILVNKDNPLPDGYEPELHLLRNGTCSVAEVMYEDLSSMLSDGSDQGLSFVVASGYRSGERQDALLEEDIQADMQNYGMSYDEAYEKETRETMPSGYSEHETGLAVDIVSLSYQILDATQGTTPEIQWLQKNCSKYGFILRYPKGKEDITGIDYESWHFRYVGREAAQAIMSKGITLEEYLGL